MPTYEYLCEQCDYRFEEFQSITADPLESCPKCGGHVRRLISSGNGLIFKGSGFYVTDYKRSNSSSNQTSGKKEKQDQSAKEKPKDTS